MPFRRVILALVMVATWIATTLHVGLEANGLTPEHEHRAQYHHDHSCERAAHDAPGDGAMEHEAVVSRISSQECRPISWLWWACVPIGGLLPWPGPSLRSRFVAIRPARRWRVARALTCWQFVWRCASFTTAPPALS